MLTTAPPPAGFARRMPPMKPTYASQTLGVFFTSLCSTDGIGSAGSTEDAATGAGTTAERAKRFVHGPGEAP